MQCGTLVRWDERRRKGSGAPYRKATRHLTWWFFHLGNVEPQIDQYEPCDGNIIANVKAADEPYFGGCSAVLEVSYKCEKCGNTFFIELPDSAEEVGAMLTEAIASAATVPLRLAAAKKHGRASGTPTRSAETTGSVGEADGGPAPKGDAGNTTAVKP